MERGKKIKEFFKMFLKMQQDENHPPVSKLNSWLLGIYLFVVLMIQVFIASMSVSEKSVLVVMLLAAIVLVPLLIFLCPRLLWLVQRISIKRNIVQREKKQKWILYFKFFFPVFSFLFVLYLCCQPGAFSVDSIIQYTQAASIEPYNDWHPVLQTLLVFTLPLKLTGSLNSIVLFQIIEFSLVLAYMAYTIAELGSVRFAFFPC